jgi:Sulfotransferase family
MRYFFVCGAPKSGTTWLQRLLDAHPQLICSGEGHFIEKFAIPIMQVFKAYNKHLALVAERVYQGKPYYEPLEIAEMIAALRLLIVQRMNKRTKSNAIAVGDKTPRYTDFLDELRAIFPTAHFLHVVRDPRDVAVSRLNHAWRAGYSDVMTPGSEMRTTSIVNSSQAWVRAQENFAKFSTKHRSQCLEMRYEELTYSPHKIIGEALNFLGVSCDNKIVETAITSASFDAWSGRKPGEEDSASFFRKGIVGDWRNSLEPAALDLIALTCGDWPQRKGYALNRH